MNRFRPFKIYYEVLGNRELIVYLCGRNEDKTRGVYELHQTEPYFYVPSHEQVPVNPLIKKVEEDQASSLWGENLTKVYTFYPFNVPDCRALFTRTFEADVVYENRIRYDLGIKTNIRVPSKRHLMPNEIEPENDSPNIAPRLCVIDIETYDKGGFAEPKYPTGPVVSISCWDSYTDTYLVILNGRLEREDLNKTMAFFRDKEWKVIIKDTPNEAEMFAVFREFLQQVKPDMICGWNSDMYDIPYLQNRAINMRYQQPNWREFAYFDLMLAFERQHEGELESKSLQYVSTSLGLEGKPVRQRTWQMWEHDRSALITYNVNDVYLTKEVMLRKNLVGFFMELVSFAGCGIEDALLTGRLVDSYVFHRLRGQLIQKTKVEGEWGSIKGAEIFEPVRGVYNNVVEIDNSGEYANIIRTFNLSPETKVDDAYEGEIYKLPSGNRYKKTPRGIFPGIIDELIALRATKKEQGLKDQERVVKEFILTFYGVLASPHYRNGDPDIGGDITHVAREHLKWNREFIERHKGIILYGDTDSCLFRFSDLKTLDETEFHAKKVADELNMSLLSFAAQYGSEKCYLGVKVEHVYDGFFQSGSKKRYACIYRDPKGDIKFGDYLYTMKVRGFEIRRSNSAPFTKTMQKDVFQKLLFGASKEVIQSYVMSIISDAKAGKIPTHLFGIPTSIQKVDYGRRLPQHVRAAYWSNQNLGKEFKAGDKPVMYFGRVRGKYPTDVFSLDWGEPVPEGTEIDWRATIERTILLPLQSVFDVIGLYPHEILQPTHKLEEFF